MNHNMEEKQSSKITFPSWLGYLLLSLVVITIVVIVVRGQLRKKQYDVDQYGWANDDYGSLKQSLVRGNSSIDYMQKLNPNARAKIHVLREKRQAKRQASKASAKNDGDHALYNLFGGDSE